MPTAPPTYSPFKALRQSGLLRPAAYERDRRRGTSHARGYDSRWTRTSIAFREKHPLCCCCEANGVIKAAEVVDHVVPHRGDKRLFWDRGNWQGLCNDCHNGPKKILESRYDQGLVSRAELRLDRPLSEFFSPPPGG